MGTKTQSSFTQRANFIKSWIAFLEPFFSRYRKATTVNKFKTTEAKF
jgi:hypothetical protein